MGWYAPLFATKRQLIKELTEVRKTTAAGGWQTAAQAIRHCYRGGQFSGVLWSVWERTFMRDDVEIAPPQRWIGCDLLEYWRKTEGWAYKPMEEASGPCYYSCPLGYLDLVPPDRYPEGIDFEWRESVRAHHTARLQKRREKRSKTNV